MNGKKVQAQMQIDVSFLADTTKLVKDLQSTTQKLNLDSSFSKQLATNLSKGFKEVFSNLDKMSEGLSKKGLSPKQYTTFFNTMNARLQESLKFSQDLKKSFQEMFNSAENKQALKDINKLASAKKGAQTRQNTAIQKLQDEFGIDYNMSKRTLSELSRRKGDKKSFTSGQKE